MDRVSALRKEQPTDPCEVDEIGLMLKSKLAASQPLSGSSSRLTRSMLHIMTNSEEEMMAALHSKMDQQLAKKLLVREQTSSAAESGNRFQSGKIWLTDGAQSYQPVEVRYLLADDKLTFQPCKFGSNPLLTYQASEIVKISKFSTNIELGGSSVEEGCRVECRFESFQVYQPNRCSLDRWVDFLRTFSKLAWKNVVDTYCKSLTRGYEDPFDALYQVLGEAGQGGNAFGTVVSKLLLSIKMIIVLYCAKRKDLEGSEDMIELSVAKFCPARKVHTADEAGFSGEKSEWTTLPIELVVSEILKGMPHRAILPLRHAYQSANLYIFLFPTLHQIARLDPQLPSYRLDLFAAIEQKQPCHFPLNWIESIVADMTSAIYWLHTKLGLVHGDLKDENIIVHFESDSKIQATLIDFGSSRFLSQPLSSWINADMDRDLVDVMLFRGTLGHACPEVIDPTTARFNPASQDVWSLGILLFTMLFSSEPFDGDASIMTCNWRGPGVQRGSQAGELVRFDVDASERDPEGMYKDEASVPARMEILLDHIFVRKWRRRWSIFEVHSFVEQGLLDEVCHSSK